MSVIPDPKPLTEPLVGMPGSQRPYSYRGCQRFATGEVMRTRAHTSNNYTDLTASGSRLARPETVLDTLTLILIVATVVLLVGLL